MSDWKPKAGEVFATIHGAEYREDQGWGHLEYGVLVHCYAHCAQRDTLPHGRFTRWVVQSQWTMEDE